VFELHNSTELRTLRMRKVIVAVCMQATSDWNL